MMGVGLGEKVPRRTIQYPHSRGGGKKPGLSTLPKEFGKPFSRFGIGGLNSRFGGFYFSTGFCSMGGRNGGCGGVYLILLNFNCFIIFKYLLKVFKELFAILFIRTCIFSGAC